MLARSLVVVLGLSIVSLTGCGQSVQVPLTAVGGSKVSGSAQLKDSFCKSPCVYGTVAVEGEGGNLGVVRRGSCAKPGEELARLMLTQGNEVSGVSKLAELRGQACIQIVAETGDTLKVLACGDIP